MNEVKEWRQSRTDDFWTSIAPCEHVLQIYNNNEELLDTLTGFIAGGVNANESVVVIATKAHLESLDALLKEHGVSRQSLIDSGRYIPLDALDTLSKFMINGQPDEMLFMKTVSAVIKRARGNDHRPVRAFGEMVAILWAAGNHRATLELEELWNKFCEKEALTLFCAYPKKGFAGKLKDSIGHVCGSHSKIITGSSKPFTEVLYQAIEPA